MDADIACPSDCGVALAQRNARHTPLRVAANTFTYAASAFSRTQTLLWGVGDGGRKEGLPDIVNENGRQTWPVSRHRQQKTDGMGHYVPGLATKTHGFGVQPCAGGDATVGGWAAGGGGAINTALPVLALPALLPAQDAFLQILCVLHALHTKRTRDNAAGAGGGRARTCPTRTLLACKPRVRNNTACSFCTFGGYAVPRTSETGVGHTGTAAFRMQRGGDGIAGALASYSGWPFKFSTFSSVYSHTRPRLPRERRVGFPRVLGAVNGTFSSGGAAAFCSTAAGADAIIRGAAFDEQTAFLRNTHRRASTCGDIICSSLRTARLPSLPFAIRLTVNLLVQVRAMAFCYAAWLARTPQRAKTRGIWTAYCGGGLSAAAFAIPVRALPALLPGDYRLPPVLPWRLPCSGDATYLLAGGRGAGGRTILRSMFSLPRFYDGTGRQTVATAALLAGTAGVLRRRLDGWFLSPLFFYLLLLFLRCGVQGDRTPFGSRFRPIPPLPYHAVRMPPACHLVRFLLFLPGWTFFNSLMPLLTFGGGWTLTHSRARLNNVRGHS